MISSDPTAGIPFLPEHERERYVPSNEDIDKVIAVADVDTADYLNVIRETLARVGEINSLKWEHVDLDGRFVVLHTRKKKGGIRRAKQVPMTQKLFDILSRRFTERNPEVEWVFYHTYWSRKRGQQEVGPFQDRKKIMKTLCAKAGVKYFRYHPLRHAGASTMDSARVPIGEIQKILGHENRTTTEIYLHSIGDAGRSAILAFERARENPT